MHPERATPSDLDALATTFALAFADDPLYRWRWRNATEPALGGYYRAILSEYIELGALWKIDGCRGGVVWMSPREAALLSDIRRDARQGQSTGPDDADPKSVLWTWLDAHLPDEPVWFLDLLAVAPAAQRRGLGRALVTDGLERAESAGCSAFVETSYETNVAFYQSQGFRVVDQGNAPDGGPTVWFMQTSR